MMIKEARLSIVIGIKKAIWTGFATQPVTSALSVPFIVRLQDAGGGKGESKLFAEAVEYMNRKYVNCGMTMSKGREELLTGTYRVHQHTLYHRFI